MLMFVAVCVFNVSTHMCTIINKMAEGFLDTKGFLETRTQTREPSCSDPRAARALLRTRVTLHTVDSGPTVVLLSFSSPSLQWRLCVLNKTVQRLRDS